TLNDQVPEAYRGMDRFEARKKLITELQAHDILIEIEDHQHKVPHGDRSGTVIEPYLTDQWYVDAEKLARPALEIIRSGAAQFVPRNWEKTYYGWLENIQPWCISRQLWWGHQIPAWYGPDGHIFVAETEAEAQEIAKKHYGEDRVLERDPDVLDTWFSSALWPFSTLGWPEKTIELEKYYPTQLLITGFDIIFFWVARMIMMATHFTGQAPFKDIYIHALVRDEKGQKMSKSKGNVIDPLTLIDHYGTDALRFTLCAMAAQGRDIKLATSRVEGYRNFGTKLWNASRFAEMNGCVFDPDFDPSTANLSLSHWILSRLKITIEKLDQNLAQYRFNDAADTLYHFIWGDICDRFIEMAKPLLSSDNLQDKQEIQKITAYILRHAYIILHPVMPFITEALAEKTTQGLPPLIHTKWPDLNHITLQEQYIQDIDLLVSMIDEIRSVRSAVNVPASAKIALYITEIDPKSQNAIEKNLEILTRMARLEHVSFDNNFSADGAMNITVDRITALSPLGDLIDITKERARLTKDIEKVKKEISAMEGRLQNEKFLMNAEQHVIDETRERLTEKQDTFSKVTRILSSF
ncbi:MAG: valine--tRNA ligase, partial [Pseudomonadota bacterium]